MPIYGPVRVLANQYELPVGERSIVIILRVIHALEVVPRHDQARNHWLQHLLPEGLHDQAPEPAHHAQLVPCRVTEGRADGVRMQGDIGINEEQPLRRDIAVQQRLRSPLACPGLTQPSIRKRRLPPSMMVSRGSSNPAKISAVRSVEPSFKTTTAMSS